MADDFSPDILGQFCRYATAKVLRHEQGRAPPHFITAAMRDLERMKEIESLSLFDIHLHV